MKDILNSQEIWSVVFISFFALVVLSATEVGLLTILSYIVGQALVFVGAIIVHELGHLYTARLAGVDAYVEWIPRPMVTCGEMSPLVRRTVAVIGPLCGALVGVLGIAALIVGLQLTVMLYMMAGSLVVVHLCMLLPFFPDGKALISKKGEPDGQTY